MNNGLLSKKFIFDTAGLLYKYKHTSIFYCDQTDAFQMRFKCDDGTEIIVPFMYLDSDHHPGASLAHLDCLALLLSELIEIHNLRNGTNYDKNEPIQTLSRFNIVVDKNKYIKSHNKQGQVIL